MTKVNEKILNEMIEKFGLFKEINHENYDNISSILFEKQIKWEQNNDPDNIDFPYKKEINNLVWKIKLNNFPEEPMYTLYIDNKAILTFDDMPTTWTS